MPSERKDFLIAMYKELFNNVDRHISLSWQSISIIASFLATIMLTEKFEVPSVITVFFLIVVIAWTMARLIDAEHWYDRNIHIISNIEKQFLIRPEDSEEIHFYFTKNRTIKSRLESVTIQRYATTFIWFLAIFYSIWRVPENVEKNMIVFGQNNLHFEPYIIIIFSIVLVFLLSYYKYHNTCAIEVLREKSPGKNCTYEVKNTLSSTLANYFFSKKSMYGLSVLIIVLSICVLSKMY